MSPQHDGRTVDYIISGAIVTGWWLNMGWWAAFAAFILAGIRIWETDTVKKLLGRK